MSTTLEVDTDRGRVRVLVSPDGTVIIRNASAVIADFPCERGPSGFTFFPRAKPRSPGVRLGAHIGLGDSLQIGIHQIARHDADALLWNTAGQTGADQIVNLSVRGDNNAIRIGAIGVGEDGHYFNTVLFHAPLNPPTEQL